MTDAAYTTTGDAEFGDYVALLKPRVMSLVVFTAAVGLIAAPGGLNPVLAFSAILFIALGAGASGALNMWWDADIDRLMERTANRPIPAGRVSPDEALAVGLALSGLSVIMLGLAANWMAAGLLAFTIFFYAVVYTMWLKRATPQNIVIGGLAGALPPAIGWLAVTGGLSAAPILMVALIFMWTPPHFWALAVWRKPDYARVGVPMLTVTHGIAETRRQIWIYSVLLIPVAIALAFTQAGGLVYLTVTLILSALFLRGAWRLSRRDDATAEADGFLTEKRFFGFTIAWLFLQFLAILAETGVRALAGPYADWMVLL